MYNNIFLSKGLNFTLTKIFLEISLFSSKQLKKYYSHIEYTL